MPSSWPQPAVLTNLLTSSSTVSDGAGANDDGKSTIVPSSYDHRVLALYKFVSPKFSKEDLIDLKTELGTICRQYSARGTLLIAEEGINGTICYPVQQSKPTTAVATDLNSNAKVDDNGVCKEDNETRDELLSFLQQKFDNALRIRISVADRPVFARLKIKIKSEIVTMHWGGDKRSSAMNVATQNVDDNDDDDNKDTKGDEDENDSSVPSPPFCGPCCPTERVGEYVQPHDWNKLLEDPDTLVIDTRNEYEIDVGTFRNAINPNTQSFVEFPDWIKKNLVDCDSNQNDNKSCNAKEKNAIKKKKKIAMFCTGGIRCEKATNAAMQLIPNDMPVYHLEGGILAYLDEISEEQSMFDGDCYVFDQRVAVTYKNRPSTTYRQKCHACRHPLSNQDLEREDYKHGVSCRYCVGQLTHQQEERFAQRQRQMELALKKGRQHIHDPKEHSVAKKTKKICMS